MSAEVIRPAADIILRGPAPGDLGWIVWRHGVLYAQEYGWGVVFEALVAQVVADFARAHDPARERCWIAEVRGERAGSVMLVDGGRRSGGSSGGSTAKLRLLLVEPHARGLGIGARLIDECLAFATAAGYRRVSLWTSSALHAARRRYEAVGFRLVKSELHDAFAPGLAAETWEKDLA